jgi:hypothetical protein
MDPANLPTPPKKKPGGKTGKGSLLAERALACPVSERTWRELVQFYVPYVLSLGSFGLLLFPGGCPKKPCTSIDPCQTKEKPGGKSFGALWDKPKKIRGL